MVAVNNSAIHTRREVKWQNPCMVDADNSAILTRHDVKRQNPRMVAVNNSAIYTRHDVKWQNSVLLFYSIEDFLVQEKACTRFAPNRKCSAELFTERIAFFA